ncbi:MAG TPA: NAD(+) diphosphatase [Bacteroidales bacterium]|jgi:NAD+ diphosphatase|nr:NAD(+) diphosphatase [Bacteroidales bacterium]
MIQDIHPHQLSNKFIEAGIRDGDYIFHYKNNALLLRRNGEGYEIPLRKEFYDSAGSGIFIFSLNNINCFLAGECTVPEDPCYIYQEINFFRTLPRRDIAWAAIVGSQLANWYDMNKYCGKCGSIMSPKKDERAISCYCCENIVYPHISPAIIVAIISKDKILLARGNNFRNGFYSLVAGYADIGESLEEAVVREVKEEVGIDVTGIRYYSSQPWPFSGSMMIGFIADADERQPIIIDNKEITEARWFNRGNLPKHPPSAISIAGEMIEKFESGKL